MTEDKPLPSAAPQGALSRACERIADAVATALRDAWSRHRLAAELADLAAYGELEHVLGEAGFSASQVGRLIADHPTAPRLLQGMTGRLGIEAAQLEDRLLRRQIEHTCSTCASQRRCRRWLRSGATGGYGDFCPNAGLFDSLLERDGRPAASRDHEIDVPIPGVDGEAEAESRKLRVMTQLPYI